MFPFSVSQFNDEFNRQMEVDLSNEIMKNREDVHLGYNKAKQRERDRELANCFRKSSTPCNRWSWLGYQCLIQLRRYFQPV